MSVTVESRRNRLRSVAAAVLTVLMLVPFGVLFAKAWGATADDRTTTLREQQGLEYLTRLGPLVTRLADVQSSALAGVTPATAELDGAVDAVAEADGRLGTDLRTRQRWTDLRKRIEDLPKVTGTSLAVYQAHVEVADLLLALFNTVRDNGLLVRDADNDIAHLQQAISVHLPETVVQANRMADLSVLVTNTPAAQRPQLNLEFSAAVASVDFAVRRLTDDLEAAVDETSSRTLSGDLLGTLDNFRRGMETLIRGANAGGQPNTATLATARSQLDQTLAALNGTIVKEMGGLLDKRLDDIDTDRRDLLVTAGAAALLALLAGAVALLGRRRGKPSGAPQAAPQGVPGVDTATGTGTHEPAARLGDEASSSWRERSGAVR